MAVMIPTLLVPLMGGSDGDKVTVVQTLLFVSGINTLIQTLFGTRLPTVLGGSYAFVIPAISIIHDSSLSRIYDDHEVCHHPFMLWLPLFIRYARIRLLLFGCTQRFLQTIIVIQGASIIFIVHADYSRLQPVVGHLFQIFQPYGNGSGGFAGRIWFVQQRIPSEDNVGMRKQKAMNKERVLLIYQWFKE